MFIESMLRCPDFFEATVKLNLMQKESARGCHREFGQGGSSGFVELCAESPVSHTDMESWNVSQKHFRRICESFSSVVGMAIALSIDSSLRVESAIRGFGTSSGRLA